MVKPALAYLDVHRRGARRASTCPSPPTTCRASTRWSRRRPSGAGSTAPPSPLEHLTAIKRAGADVILTYFAREVAERRSAVTHQRRAFERAQRVMPGGVNSPVRAFRSVGGTPYFVARAEGAYVWDVEGRRYLDYVQSLRRVDPRPRPPRGRRGRAAGGRPTAPRYGAPTEREVLLAEAIVRPGARRARRCASCRAAPRRPCRPSAWPGAPPAATEDRQVRRLLPRPQRRPARRRRQRRGRPGPARLGRRDRRARWPTPSSRPTTSCPRSTTTSPRSSSSRSPPTWASSPPAPGFLEGLRAACDRGRRAADLRRGHHRLPARPAAARRRLFGVTPDLWCFGKVIGGGLPVGAFGGRGRRDGAPGAARARVPGGHPVGEPARHRRRPRRARAARRRRLHDARRAGPPSWPPPARGGRRGRRACRRAGPRGRAAVGLYFAETAARPTTTRPRPASATASTAGSSGPCSTAGVALAPGPYEAAVPVAGPHARTTSSAPSTWPSGGGAPRSRRRRR